MLGLFLVSAFVTNLSYVNTEGPGTFILVLPFATALAVYYLNPDGWFVWIAFAINFLVVVLIIALSVGLLFSGDGGIGAAFFAIFLIGVPTGLNAFTMWLLLGRLKAARRAQ